jgi:hypothetical protein
MEIGCKINCTCEWDGHNCEINCTTRRQVGHSSAASRSSAATGEHQYISRVLVGRLESECATAARRLTGSDTSPCGVIDITDYRLRPGAPRVSARSFGGNWAAYSSGLRSKPFRIDARIPLYLCRRMMFQTNVKPVFAPRPDTRSGYQVRIQSMLGLIGMDFILLRYGGWNRSNGAVRLTSRIRAATDQSLTDAASR